VKLIGYGTYTGKLIYSRSEQSFGFIEEQREDLELRGNSYLGTMYISGMEINVSNAGNLYGLWGYDNQMYWQEGKISPFTRSADKTFIQIDDWTLNEYKTNPNSLVTMQYDLRYTVYDAESGWIWIGSPDYAPYKMPAGTEYIEYSTNCVACIADYALIALLLKPEFVD
jgi:hypothetical protein